MDYRCSASYSSSLDPVTALIVAVITLGITVLMLATMWRVYEKAGKPGWAAIVPIYNMVVLLEIVGRPPLWILLFFIPFVNFVLAIMVTMDLAKSFGKSSSFGLLLVFLPFIGYPILAFDKTVNYVGPAAATA